jgi:Tfp pilus assembly protein PilF
VYLKAPSHSHASTWSVLVAAVLLAASSGCHMAATGQNLEGVRLYEQGQYQTAQQKFQQAITTNPADPEAYYNLAATTHRMGVLSGDRHAMEQAETLYNQCLDLSPNHVECHRALAVLLVETGRADRAFALLKNWAVRSPQSADAPIEVARLYQEFGDKETAKRYLDQALAIDYQSSRAWSALGHLREQSGDYGQALANYQRSYNLNSFQPSVADRIAELRKSTGDLGVTPAGGTRTAEAGFRPPRY